MPRNENLRWSLYLLSLILHVLILLTIKLESSGPQISEGSRTLKIVLKERKIAPEVSERLKKRRQIVNNELNGEERLSNETTYYGEKKQTYKEEMIPKKLGSFKEGKSLENENKKKEKSSADIKMSDLVIKKPSDIEKYAVEKRPRHKTFYAEITGDNEAQNNDFIQDVKLGDATNLNTQEYKFWGFFNRMRARLEPIWEKLLDERIRRYFTHEKKIIVEGETMTLVKITLDGSGNVFSAEVLHSSGKAEIDDIAIDAIVLSGPFASVPREMLSDNFAEIEWGFVLRP